MDAAREERIERLGRGDPAAAEALVPEVYEELRAIAHRMFGEADWNSTLSPTAVVHEAYLRLAGNPPEAWSGRSHFLALGARVMRQVLVDHHRRRGAAKRGGDWRRITLSVATADAPAEQIDFLTLEDLLERLAAADPRQAQIVEMRFLAGLTAEEVAAHLGVSLTTVEAEWRHARAWLKRRLEGQ